MNLEFDEVLHSYALDGKPIPGVTSILREAGIAPEFFAVDPDTLERARQEGQAVHRACELFDQGRLRWDTVHESILPRVKAWAYLREAFSFEPFANEVPVFSKLWGYAGRLDVAGWLHWRTRPRAFAIADWKRSDSVHPAAGLQLAGYRIAWNEMVDSGERPDWPRVEATFVVRLDSAGKGRLVDPAMKWPHLKPFGDRFLAAVTTHHTARLING